MIQDTEQLKKAKICPWLFYNGKIPIIRYPSAQSQLDQVERTFVPVHSQAPPRAEVPENSILMPPSNCHIVVWRMSTGLYKKHRSIVFRNIFHFHFKNQVFPIDGFLYLIHRLVNINQIPNGCGRWNACPR